MATQTRNIRYPDWIKKAVAEFTIKNGFSNDSKAFIWLLSSQLNRYGYFEETYTTITDKPLHEEIEKPIFSQQYQQIIKNEDTEKPDAPGPIIAGMGRYGPYKGRKESGSESPEENPIHKKKRG